MVSPHLSLPQRDALLVRPETVSTVREGDS